MAEGGIPIAAQSGPTTTITLTLRSAGKDVMSQADFNYTDDVAARCGQFDLAYTESGMTSTYAVQLLNAPPAGEKRFAWMQNTKPHPPQDFGSVGLRVLAGTLSVSLGLSVAELNSEADARPALDSMAGLAQELIDQATQHPPSVAAALPNSRTPDDLVALLKGITGPNGNPVNMRTGERHVLVGARKGTLTVEAGAIRFSAADVQSGADGLAAVIGQVFAKAGL